MTRNDEPDRLFQQRSARLNVLTSFEDQIHKISSEYNALESKLHKARHSKYHNVNFAYLNHLNNHILMMSDVVQFGESSKLKRGEEILSKQIQIIKSPRPQDEKMDALLELKRILTSYQGYDLRISKLGILDALMEELSDVNKENHVISLCLEILSMLTTFADFENCKKRAELVSHVISRLGKNKTINTIEFLTQILANCSNIPGKHDPIIGILDTLVQNLQLSKSVMLFQHSIRCIVNLYVNNQDRDELKKINILDLVTSSLESQLKSVKEQALWCFAYLSFNARDCFKSRPDLITTLCKITIHNNASKPAHSMTWICLANLVLIEEYSSKIIEFVSNAAMEFLTSEVESIIMGIKSPLLYGVISYIANMLYTDSLNIKSVPVIPLIANIVKIMDYGDFEIKAQAARILARLSANKDLHRRIEASQAFNAVLDVLCMGYKNIYLLEVIDHFASNPNFYQKLNHPIILYTLAKLSAPGTNDSQIQLVAHNILERLQQYGDVQLNSCIEEMMTSPTSFSKNIARNH
ncbi:uncharacterized protein LOC126316746 isoform X1 [Schistocerca gregaria]|uniref:uncharacterized protein LOC126316746 isoform X1 n=1 Tax=Schistocerca gregaria TaxID=7010 RepID=UPI00211E1582|nr:uncharacterized protein LOC126316746 isoform X1 [Schistocerca gregaria]